MNKKIPTLFLIFSLLAIPIASANFLDFITGFVTNTDAGSIEEQCKRSVSLFDGETKTFEAFGQKYEIILDSILGSNVKLKVNTVPLTTTTAVLKTSISDKLSITVEKITETATNTGARKGINLIFNKESDKCSCVSNLINVKAGELNKVSDGTNTLSLEMPEFLYDGNYKVNNYVIYKVDGVTSEKTRAGETVTIQGLSDIKIITKSINSDNTATILIDNSKICQIRADLKKQAEEQKDRALIYLGKLVSLQLQNESDDSTTYLVKIPKGEEGNVVLISSEGRFDLMGKKLAEEKAQEIICPEPVKQKTFWEKLTGK